MSAGAPAPGLGPGGETRLERPGGRPAAAVLVPLESIEDLQPAGPDSERLRQAFSVLRRRKWSIVAGTLAGLSLGWLLTMTREPLYRARLTLELQPLNERFLGGQEVTPTAPVVGVRGLETDIATAVGILHSSALVSAAAARVGLDVTERENFEQSLVVQPVRGTRIVEARYESAEPEKAAEFLNALGAEFIAYSSNKMAQIRRRTLASLSTELDLMKRELQRSELALQDYSQAASLLFANDRSSIEQQRLARLEEELSRATAARTARQAEYEAVVEGSLEAAGDPTEALVRLQLRLAELEQTQAELRSVFTSDHPKVRRLTARIGQARKSIASERASESNRVQSRYEASTRREELLRERFAKQAAAVSAEARRAVEYDMLQREARSRRALYDDLLRQVQQTRVAAMTDFANVHVLDAATPPRTPASPSGALNALLGLSLGLAAAVAFVFVTERLDTTVRRPGDLNACTGLEELGLIPDAGNLSSPERPDAVGGAEAEGKRIERTGRKSEYERAIRLVSEHARATLTSILLSEMNCAERNRTGELRRLLISSPGPGEGKSTLVGNLALALANIQRRVLIMDADFRKPRMHSIFGVSNERGLSDMLIERAGRSRRLGDGESGAAWALPTSIEELSVLPAGGAGVAAANLLYDDAMFELLDQAEHAFDYVLIDTPPLLRIADARIVGRLGAQVILVARAGRTTREALAGAVDRLERDGIPILGTVLNGLDATQAGYGGYS